MILLYYARNYGIHVYAQCAPRHFPKENGDKNVRPAGAIVQRYGMLSCMLFSLQIHTGSSVACVRVESVETSQCQYRGFMVGACVPTSFARKIAPTDQELIGALCRDRCGFVWFGVVLCAAIIGPRQHG